MYESLEKILQMEEFDKDLQDELSAAYPKDGFIHVLNSAKRDLIKNDCGIIVTGTFTNIMAFICSKMLTFRIQTWQHFMKLIV